MWCFIAETKRALKTSTYCKYLNFLLDTLFLIFVFEAYFLMFQLLKKLAYSVLCTNFLTDFHNQLMEE